MNNKEQVLEHLRRALDDYLNQNASRNLVSLSKSCKVNESTLRRAYNKQSVPTPDNMVKILIGISGEKSIYKLSKLYSNEIGEYLHEAFPNLVHEASSDTSDLSINEDTFRDFHKYLVFKRIAHRDQVTRKDIKELLGDLGLNKLNELITEELVSESNDGILKTSEKEFSLPLTIYKQHCPRLIELFFKPQEALNGGLSMIRNISDSVDLNGFEEALKILTRASSDLYKVVKANPGSIPLLYVSMIDTLAFNGIRSNGGNNNE